MESGDEDAGVGLDGYPGRAVLGVGGDGMMPARVWEEVVAQCDNREANGIGSGLQRVLCCGEEIT